jgi:hypothetical protein
LETPYARKRIDMSEHPTCGEGLASHSTLPTKLGDLTAAVGDVLEVHTTALDLNDENARRERDAYLKLVAEHRRTAAELRSTAEEMLGYRDLPIARHDPNAMSAPAAADAFDKFHGSHWRAYLRLRRRVWSHIRQW